MSKVISTRIDDEQYIEAMKKNIDLNVVVKAAIADALKINKCPYCGQKMKPNKGK